MSSESGQLVSVVVPTYNRGAHCLRAVRSVLEQSHQEVEVLVVDDGSTDDTGALVSDLDPRVRYFRQENAGVATARNRGLAEARGDFIALLDSDDVFLPWKLEAQLGVLRAYPEAGMVWTDMAAVDEDGRLLRETYLPVLYGSYRRVDREEWLRRGRTLGTLWDACPKDLAERRCAQVDLRSLIVMGNLVHTSTVLMRRERQQEAGLFDPELWPAGEDYDFHFRVCRAGPVAYLDVSSILYRVGAHDQITHARNDGAFSRGAYRTVSRALRETGGQVGLPPHMVRERLSRLHLSIGMAELRGDRSEARRHLLRSLLLKPWATRVVRPLVASLLPERIHSAISVRRRRPSEAAGS